MSKKYKNKSYKLYEKRRNYSLDNAVGYATLWLILLYIGLFAYAQTKGFVWTRFDPTYAVIVIPIWLVDGLKVFLESFTSRSYRTSTEDISKITVVIACKDGDEVIENTLKSLLKRFDPDQIIVASNGSTDHTCLIAEHYDVRLLEIREPVGKVRAINKALNLVTTPYVLILDDDTLVEKAMMPTGLLDEGYEGVAFRVLVHESTWLTKIQAFEYRKTTDLGKRYHNGKASVQNISGAVGLFSLKELRRQIKKHSGEFSGEDLQRTLLIHLAQDAKGVILTDSTVYTQPPTNLRGLFKQRVFSWFPGLFANIKNYLKVMTRDQMPTPLRFDAFYNVFFVMFLDALRLLSLPILILYPWYFLITYVTYALLETITYLRTDKAGPYWVVLVYPLYGLFGFITRVCAFATFMYRRFAVKFARKKFLDDFRGVNSAYKYMAIAVSVAIMGSILALNAFFFFIKPVLNIGI